MNLRGIFHAGGVLALAVLLPGACLAAENAIAAAYVEGTVEAIPWNTTGRLELARTTGLRFQYGDSAYRIPARQVTGYRLGRRHQGLKSQLTAGVSRVGHTMLPMLFHNNTRYLSVEFRSPGSTDPQRVVFRVSKQAASTALPVLEAWTASSQAVPAARQAQNDEDSWWGNRYWKTERNRHLWEAREKSHASSRVELATRQ